MCDGGVHIVGSDHGKRVLGVVDASDLEAFNAEFLSDTSAVGATGSVADNQADNIGMRGEQVGVNLSLLDGVNGQLIVGNELHIGISLSQTCVASFADLVLQLDFEVSLRVEQLALAAAGFCDGVSEHLAHLIDVQAVVGVFVGGIHNNVDHGNAGVLGLLDRAHHCTGAIRIGNDAVIAVRNCDFDLLGIAVGIRSGCAEDVNGDAVISGCHLDALIIQNVYGVADGGVQPCKLEFLCRLFRLLGGCGSGGCCFFLLLSSGGSGFRFRRAGCQRKNNANSQ